MPQQPRPPDLRRTFAIARRTRWIGPYDPEVKLRKKLEGEGRSSRLIGNPIVAFVE